MPAHPSRKDKNAARMGHPEFAGGLEKKVGFGEFASGLAAFPPFAKYAMDGAPVKFQEVVHSIELREADCDEQQVSLEGIEWTFIRMPD
jgi:hypothetical protein